MVAGILIIFSVSVYMFYLKHRQKDFLSRLRNKALNTTTLLVRVKGIDSQFLKIIDDNTVTNMNDVTVIVLDSLKHVIYTNRDTDKIAEVMPAFKNLNWEQDSHRFFKAELYLCVQPYYRGHKYYVLASGIDLYGQSELKELLIIIFGVFIFSLILIVIAGYYNARQSLRPIKDIIKQVDAIKASNLNNRLAVKNDDEIAELAQTFNKMLERVEQAFDTERMFVSNASHELRTPVTSVIGQIEVALNKPRSDAEYKITLVSVLDDVQNMKTIINSFLDLAETSVEPNNFKFNILRTDELLFSVKDDILRRKPNYQVIIEFENLPDDESEVSVKGNDRLLKVMLSNLIDNACKFSAQNRVAIKIGHDNFYVTIRLIDTGIGIPSVDIKNIFEPLYRASNAIDKNGYGIGLSIVKRIVDIHHAKIEINSIVNIGTVVTLTFPNARISNPYMQFISANEGTY